MEGLREHHPRRQAVVKYMNDVVPKRNKLGHRVLAPTGKPTGISAGDELISLDDMRKLRRSILGLRIEFREFLDALGK
jgi:hypothetical protein